MATPAAAPGPAQLQAINQQLETHIAAAKDLLADLEQRFAHLTPDGETGGLTREDHFTQVSESTAHVEDGMQKLTQSVTETAAHSQQTLSQLSTVYTQFNQQVTLGEQGLQSCQERVQTHGEETLALLEQFQQTVQHQFEQTRQAYQATEQTIAQLHQTGLQTFGTVEAALHEFAQNAIQNSQTELDSTAQQVQDQLRNLGQQRIQDFVQTVQGRLDDAQTHFTQVSHELGQKTQGEVEQLLSEVGQFTQQQGQQHVQQQVEQLTQGAMQRLSEELILSIAETEAGAAVTGALTPIMPQLLVVYKATEAIKGAIQIFKDMKQTLGGIGHALGIS